MFCKNCGHQLDDRAVICMQCGVPVDRLNLGIHTPQVTDERINGLGIAAFAVSLASLILGVYFALVALAGLGLGIAAFVIRNKYNKCNGLAIAGFIIGIISSVFWVMIWIIILAVPVY